jgi:hypothetical protein
MIKIQRDQLGSVLKELGANISHLACLAKMKLPLVMHDYRTLLEIFAYQHVLFSYFFDKAIEEDFPLERLKLVKFRILFFSPLPGLYQAFI